MVPFQIITKIASSLKTAENLSVVKSIPIDRIMVESDAPWCEIRPSHAGFAHIQTKVKADYQRNAQSGLFHKSRNEPLASRLDQLTVILTCIDKY